MYFDVISLDSEVSNNYAQILRQGQSLNISFHSSLCQSQAVLSSEFSLQIIRNLSRVKSFFITFSHDKEVDSKPDSTQFWHPDTENQDSTIEYNSSIGGKRLIINPIGPKDSAQFYYNLLKAAGLLGSQLASTSITYEEFLGISNSSERQIFAICQDTEKNFRSRLLR